MRPPLTRRPRRGFTLVELLVACALTVLIMAVLATAFKTGLDTFSNLKSTVGLSEQLRAAESVMRRDLEAPHLENADGVAVRVSSGATAPRGYFEVLQATQPNAATFVKEGTEDGTDSYRGTDQAIFCTTHLGGKSAQELYFGEAPDTVDPSFADYLPQGSTYASDWAELAFFLRPSGPFTKSDDPTVLPVQLFTLHRRQRVLARKSVLLPFGGAYATPDDYRTAYPDASISSQVQLVPPGPMPPPVQYARLNDPSTVQGRRDRFGYYTTGPAAGSVPDPVMPDSFGSARSFSSVLRASGAAIGTDILVTNVVSMHVRVLDGTGKFYDRFTQVPNPAPSPPAPPYLPGSGVAPPTSYPNSGATEGFRLDTAPANVQMRAIQIKLRVYDTKNRLTRQLTMSFDL